MCDDNDMTNDLAGDVNNNCQSVDVHLWNVPMNEYRQGVKGTHNKERLPKCAWYAHTHNQVMWWDNHSSVWYSAIVQLFKLSVVTVDDPVRIFFRFVSDRVRFGVQLAPSAGRGSD